MTIGRLGEPAPRFSGDPFNRPTDIAVAAEGSIFISDGYGNARVQKYTAGGECLISWGEPGIDPGQFQCPHNIALRGDRVYVADRGQTYRLRGGTSDERWALLSAEEAERQCRGKVRAEEHRGGNGKPGSPRAPLQ